MTEENGSTGGAVRRGREDEGESPGESPNKGLQQKPRVEQVAQVAEQVAQVADQVAQKLTFAQAAAE